MNIRRHMRWAVVAAMVAVPCFARGAETARPLVLGETFTLRSAVLRETRRINVYLPPAYRASRDLRLPVLYMPDGGVEEDFIHVAGLLQVLIGNGSMRPFILVGIENTERRRDLTGPTDRASDKSIAPRVGGSANFRAFIRKELFPEVGRRYRTTGERAIVGESLAGLFIVETFLLDPQMFDTYIAFDPSLWWNGGALVAAAQSKLPNQRDSAKTLFLAASSDADDATMAAFVKTLRDAAPPKLRWTYEAMPAEKHSTIYHPAALRAFRTVLAPAAANGGRVISAP